MRTIIPIEKALSFIESGSRVFVHGCAATPQYLNRLLASRAGELRNVEIVSLLPLDDTYTNPDFKDSFFINSLFSSVHVRQSILNGHGSYIPVFLSEIPRLFREQILPLDAALIQVSPPDKHGYCSLGVSVDITLSAVKNAKKIFAQINQRMPRIHGDGFIHIDKIDSYVEYDEPLIELDYSRDISETEKKIGQYVATLVEDGSTLQMGMGPVPDSVLKCLNNHKNLGLHSELISDGVIPLMENNVITNKMKKIFRGKNICSFLMGTKTLYEYVNDNPNIFALDVSFVNDPSVIRQNPKVCAINSCLEIDLTGQVCSDSLGTLHYSGVGGQLDFIRGAALSSGGKPILTLPSQTSKGQSRIVNTLKEGASVTTTRAHAHYVVTEYGIAYLFGKNYQQRAKELIKIAHPNHREQLEKAAMKRFKRIY